MLRYLTTWIAFLVIVLAYLSVDQIRHVFPASDSDLLFRLYSWTVVLGYVTVFAGLMRGWGSVQVEQFVQWAARLRLNFVLGALSVIGFCLTAFLSPAQWATSPIDPEIVGSAAMLALLWAIWLTGVRFSFCTTKWNVFAPEALQFAVRALLAITLLTIAGEVVWIVALKSPWASPRAYTVGALCHTAFLVLAFCGFFDTWASTAKGKPVWALGWFLIAGLVLWGLHAPSVGKVATTPATPAGENFHAGEVTAPIDLEQIPVTATSHPETWLGQLLLRLGSQGADRSDPVVIVTPSGGGARAALFAALIFDDFSQSPVTIDAAPSSSQGESYDVHGNVAMISSVSGGTLGSALYVSPGYQNQLRKNGPTRTPAKNSYLQDTLELMNAEAAELAANERFQQAHPGGDIAGISNECKSRVSSKEPWGFQTRTYIDDMCTDFMAPLLRGVFHPQIERGTSVTRYWERTFSLSDTNLSRRQGAAEESSTPLLLCNATDVSTGSAVVIGFPEIDPGFFGSAGASSGQQNTVPVRGLFDVNPQVGRELTLAECVRISANFPWGFQVPDLEIEQTKIHTTTKAKTNLHLIDGGVFDNTGITTIRAFFTRLEQLAASEGTLMRAQASLVLNELRRRGVILLEIDSGAKQQPPSIAAQALSGVLEPVTALNNAAYGTAGYMRQQNIAAVKASLQSSRVADLQTRLRTLVRQTEKASATNLNAQLAGSIDLLYHVVVVCNEEENVMTAWALGPNDKAKIFVRFLVAKEELRRKIRDVIVTHRYLDSRLAQLRAVVEELEAAADGNDPPDFDSEVRPAVEFMSGLIKARDALQIDTELEQRLNQLYAHQATTQQIEAISNEYKDFAVQRTDLESFDGVSNAMKQSAPAMVQQKVFIPSASAPAEIPVFGAAGPEETPKSGTVVDTGLKGLDQKLDVLKAGKRFQGKLDLRDGSQLKLQSK